MFSKKTDSFGGIPNRLYREKEARIREGLPLLDLVSANMHSQGILFPESVLRKGVQRATPQAKTYQPDPQGQQIARLAIQKYYEGQHALRGQRALRGEHGDWGIFMPADQIVLTPGTSISYNYLFNLLAENGEEILCPTPTYPLFDSIATLCDVKMVYYRLVPTATRWEIDFDHLRKKITTRTRAIILISPHNPTGAVANRSEVEQLCQIAKEHRLPIISDEVFSPFLYTGEPLPRPAGTDAPLVFTLNGVSKMMALPGLKIGWIALTGEPSLVKKALLILRGISDTYLPVNELIQFALPTLLDEGKSFMEQYYTQIRRLRTIATETLSKTTTLSFIPPEGGFYITLQMTDPRYNDEKVAVDLLQKEGILVHPGYFYDLPPRSLVLSFVLRAVRLKSSLTRIIQYFNQPITKEDHYD